jgi:hypothetical protein
MAYQAAPLINQIAPAETPVAIVKTTFNPLSKLKVILIKKQKKSHPKIYLNPKQQN